MSLNVQASYAKLPTTTENGIIGVKITASSPVTRPIHIALVLDQSGSMEGTRITAVKNTLSVLVDKLTIGDKITIIGFSSSAVKIAANVIINDDAARISLKSSVENLIADGGTNMESGIAMLGSLFTGGVDLPDSLVLLTDGFVNEGITSVSGMYSLLKSYVPNVPVYALGYGDDHNSDFMRGLSQRTSGTYTFIDNEIALPASIGELLGALQGEVGKAGVLSFPESWTCLELGSTGNTHGLGSLIADKPTWAILSVPAGTTVCESGDIMLTFKYVNTTDTKHVAVYVREELDRLDIIEQHLRCVAASALDAAGGFIKVGNIDSAKQAVVDAITKISTSEAALRPLAIRMKAQLDEMNEEIAAILITPPRIRRGNRADLTNLLQRTNGTASRYQQQRGVSSQAADDDDMFSSPTIIRRQQAMVAGYSQSLGAHVDDPHDSPDDMSA
jgi:hypothetical protein